MALQQALTDAKLKNEAAAKTREELRLSIRKLETNYEFMRSRKDEFEVKVKSLSKNNEDLKKVIKTKDDENTKIIKACVFNINLKIRSGPRVTYFFMLK